MSQKRWVAMLRTRRFWDMVADRVQKVRVDGRLTHRY
jgi:hypothetical protein